MDRRSFLDGARTFAVSGLTAGAVFETMRPNYAWAQAGKETHPASARILDQLRTRFTFQISVDVATIQQGLGVAGAALKGGVHIVEMGTPLLKNEGVSNVVPAFRKQFPRALLPADMKTMDGGASEARGVYAGGNGEAASAALPPCTSPPYALLRPASASACVTSRNRLRRPCRTRSCRRRND